MKAILDKVTYHAVYDDSIVDALRYARGHGFAGIQVAVEAPHLSFENLTDGQRDEIASFRAEHDLWLSLHAPDDLTSLFATSSPLREGILSYFQGLFGFAEKVGARLVTIHAGSMSRFRTDDEAAETIPRADRHAYRRAFGANLQAVVDQVRGRFVLCVEYYRPEPMVEDLLGPHLDAGTLSLCWDLAKTFDGQMNRDSRLEQYFRDHLDRVRQVHLHDVRDGRSHRVLGTGRIDLMAYLPRLAEADVLEYCIEVRPREKATESLAHLTGWVQAHCPSEPEQCP